MSDVIVQPAIEPVTLAEAKLRLEEIDFAHDALITMLIGAARSYAENYCARSFITQTRRLTLDAFPEGVLHLDFGPVLAVTSIVYVDPDGASTTVASPGAPAYTIDLSGQGGRITPGYSQSWPVTRKQIAAAQVNYSAGYGPTASDVPTGIKNWILMRVCTIFENREEVAVLQRGSVSALPYVDCLLDEFIAYRVR